MSLDSASFPIFWQIYNETGIRPEWLIPVLYAESGLNPAIPNQAGQPFYGINQASASLIQQFAGTDPQTYLTWPASRQLQTVVLGFMKGLVASYGPLRSGVRVYLANFLPATLPAVKHLTDTVTAAPSAYYNANKGLDAKGKGYISLQDLANFVARAAATQTAKDAIAQAYASVDTGSTNPYGPETDPVYGLDYGFYDKHRPWFIAGAIFLSSAAVAYGLTIDQPPKRNRRKRS